MPTAIPVINDDEKIRLSLDLTPQMKAVLEELARKIGSTQADVLRRAIALLKVVKDAEAQGETPALLDKNGKIAAKLVGM